MKIAVLTDGMFPYVIGGMQKYAYSLIKNMASHDQIEIDVYQPESDKYDVNALEFFSAEERKKINSVAVKNPRAVRYPGHYVTESYLFSKNLFALLHENLEKYDLILAQGFTAWHLLEQKARRRVSVPPVIVHFHGFEMFQTSLTIRHGLQSYLLRKAVRYNIGRADLVASYGGRIDDIVVSLGVPRAKMIRLVNGVADEWLVDKAARSRAKRKFIFIGRYERRKGITELNEAIGRLTAEADFHFIGPIPDHLRLTSPSIHYHGVVVGDERISRIMRECDVLVCPSLAEGMPTVILEGMSQGLAVIATDVGATASMVDDANGWLIAPGNVDALCSALTSAISLDEDALFARKTASLLQVKRFLWPAVTHESIERIKSALHRDELEAI